ncbi:MAG TPA: GntR family transcriptional regulator [Mycobacteriales bacterium]|nr:GntR family transcriptional regulator [Mycobacteriales bacterium]
MPSDSRVTRAAAPGADQATLDRASFVPLHAQLANQLERRILSGAWTPGAAMPSESALCAQYRISRITVRRALNDLENEGLVERVRGRGTFVAQTATRRGHAIGMVFGGLSEATFGHRNAAAFGDLVQGAAEAASNRQVLIHPLPVDNENLRAGLETPVITRLTGLLVHLTRRIDEGVLATLESLQLPYVVVKRRLPPGTASCVFLDDRAGAEAATEHLLSLGHKRIGLILGPDAIGVWEDRLAGYEAAHRKAGVRTDPRLIRHTDYPMDEAGRQVAAELLGSGAPPTAIFAGNDYIAWGVYLAARAAGREPGQDLAVVGYGANTFTTTMHPALTTVGTSGRTLGSTAAELLLDLIDGRQAGPVQQEIPWQLLIRDSSTAHSTTSTDVSA